MSFARINFEKVVKKHGQGHKKNWNEKNDKEYVNICNLQKTGFVKNFTLFE